MKYYQQILRKNTHFPPSSPGRLGAHLVVLGGNEQEQAQERQWD